MLPEVTLEELQAITDSAAAPPNRNTLRGSRDGTWHTSRRLTLKLRSPVCALGSSTLTIHGPVVNRAATQLDQAVLDPNHQPKDAATRGFGERRFLRAVPRFLIRKEYLTNPQN